MSRKNREYTNEFKEEAISLALRSPSISGTAKDLGIPEATLHGWIRHKTKQSPKLAPEQINIHDELKNLRKEIARLREEKEILKKAAAYFAKECR